MPVEIIVTDTKYNSQFYNDIDFSQNLTEYGLNLAGSVMSKVKITQSIDIKYFATTSGSNNFEVKNNNTIVRDIGTWEQDGLSVGDSIEILSVDPFIGSLITTITAITDNVMIIAGSYTNNTYTRMLIYGLSDLTALVYKYNLIGNDEQINFTSKVSGEDLAFYASGINTSAKDLQVQGKFNSVKTGTATIKSVANADPYTQSFEITHDLIINPYYIDGQLNNLIDKKPPALFEGLNTIKYVGEFEFRRDLSNPSTKKVASVTNILGSVGWFNETFNGFDSDYNLDSVTYEDDATGQSIDGIGINGKTNVTVIVNKISGNFASGNKAGVYFSYLPPVEDYTETLTAFQDNFMYDNDFCIEGAGATTGSGIITNIDSSISTNKLTLTFDIEFDSDQIKRLSSVEDPYFLLGIQAGDINISFGDSDSVMLSIVDKFETTIDIPDLVNTEQIRLYRHDMTEADEDTQFSQLGLWVEDGIWCKYNFNIDLSKSAFLNNIKHLLLAYNNTTGEYFELDSYNINTANYSRVSGVQQLELSTTRGYKLAEGSPFNYVELVTGAKVGDLQSYELKIGQKITYQDWQSLADADPIFYDNTKPHNNLNRKASNYSDKNNYTIKVGLLMSVDGVSVNDIEGTTDYLLISPDCLIDDYDQPEDITAEIKTFDPDTLVDLEGIVYKNKPTLFKTFWGGYDVSGGVGDFWAIHRLQVNEQDPIFELSSINPFIDRNPLQPLGGETQLKIEIDGSNVVTSCLINPSYLTTTLDYKLSSRIDNGSPPLNSKSMTTGVMKMTTWGAPKTLATI